jgi:hypothetical protein
MLPYRIATHFYHWASGDICDGVTWVVIDTTNWLRSAEPTESTAIDDHQTGSQPRYAGCGFARGQHGALAGAPFVAE